MGGTGAQTIRANAVSTDGDSYIVQGVCAQSPLHPLRSVAFDRNGQLPVSARCMPD